MQFKFLNLAKPKKVFEKLNKMDRKQAYTVGAIITVAIIALLMLVSSLGGEEDPMQGMNPRGYDLASMPFVNDLAEQELLASRYPDMRENGSTLLYSSQEKKDRQEASAAEEYELVPVEEIQPAEASPAQQEESKPQEYTGSYGGAGAGAGRVASRTPTAIGKLTSAGMATSSGSGISSTWGPSVDNRGLNGQTGYVGAAATTGPANAKQDLRQARFGSYAAARNKNRMMTDARKAMQNGNIAGTQQAKQGPEIGKFGGLTSETGDVPHMADLGALDEAVDNAVKDQQKKEKPEEKMGFWEQLGQDLLRQAAGSLVDSVMSGVGDSIKGWVNGNSASRTAGKKAAAERMGVPYDQLTATEQQALKDAGITKETWDGGKVSTGKAYRALKGHSTAIDNSRYEAKAAAQAKARGSTPSSRDNDTQVGQTQCSIKCDTENGWTLQQNMKDGTCKCVKAS